jgi:hypothetical protein
VATKRRTPAEETYRKWWVGKMCRTNRSAPFRLCVDVLLHGPPSFVYGDAELVFADGTTASVQHGQRFRPAKKDVEVERKP